jgi:hypothetical protein
MSSTVNMMRKYLSAFTGAIGTDKPRKLDAAVASPVTRRTHSSSITARSSSVRLISVKKVIALSRDSTTMLMLSILGRVVLGMGYPTVCVKGKTLSSSSNHFV